MHAYDGFFDTLYSILIIHIDVLCGHNWNVFDTRTGPPNPKT